MYDEELWITYNYFKFACCLSVMTTLHTMCQVPAKFKISFVHSSQSAILMISVTWAYMSSSWTSWGVSPPTFTPLKRGCKLNLHENIFIIYPYHRVRLGRKEEEEEEVSLRIEKVIKKKSVSIVNPTFNLPALSTPNTGGGGGHLPWFWVRMCGWSPRTPPHSYTRPSEKHDPFIYFPYRKLTPFIYYFWKLTPFIYYFSNFTHSYTFWVKKDTPLIYFWCKNDTHSYTGRPEKYTPFQPHICIYLYNGSYPPVTPNRRTTIGSPWTICSEYFELKDWMDVYIYSELKGTRAFFFNKQKIGSLRLPQLTKCFSSSSCSLYNSRTVVIIPFLSQAEYMQV